MQSSFSLVHIRRGSFASVQRRRPRRVQGDSSQEPNSSGTPGKGPVREQSTTATQAIWEKGVLAVLPLETSRHGKPGIPQGAAHRPHMPYVARSSSASRALPAFPSSNALRSNLPPGSAWVLSSYGPPAWSDAREGMRHRHRMPCRTCIRPAGRIAHVASLDHLSSILRFCSRSAAVKTSSRNVGAGPSARGWYASPSLLVELAIEKSKAVRGYASCGVLTGVSSPGSVRSLARSSARPHRSATGDWADCSPW